jgi:hypothetical protein
MGQDSTLTHIGVNGSNANDTGYAINLTGNAVTITGIILLPKTSVSTNASNYITTTISAGGVTLATHTTNSSGGSAMVAGTPLNLTFAATGVGTALELASAGVITVAVVSSGTGPAYNFTSYFPLRYNRV